MDLDVAQKETHKVSYELFRIKNAYDESVLQLVTIKKENKTLSSEIKDIMDHGRSIHEIDKICKRLEAEQMELEVALSVAEGALEQEENNIFCYQLELTQVKQEVAQRIHQKEEECASTKKNLPCHLRECKWFGSRDKRQSGGS